MRQGRETLTGLKGAFRIGDCDLTNLEHVMVEPAPLGCPSGRKRRHRMHA